MVHWQPWVSLSRSDVRWFIYIEVYHIDLCYQGIDGYSRTVYLIDILGRHAVSSK